MFFVDENEIQEPSAPRQRKVPKRFEQPGNATHEYPATAKEHYRQTYFEAFDLVMAGIKIVLINQGMLFTRILKSCF